MPIDKKTMPNIDQVISMHPRFYIEREKEHDFFYKDYVDGTGYLGFHSSIELYFVEDGEIEAVIDNQKKILTKNQMSVALSFAVHTYRTVKSSRSSVLIIPTDMCDEFISNMKHKKTMNPFICDEQTVTKIKGYVNELNNKDISPIRKKGYIYVILGMIMENLKFEETDETIDIDLSSKILMYINDNFAMDITLESISEHFGYNKSYISRYFKKCFGMGLSRYITLVRLKNAIMLMGDEKNTVTYCAFESGFNSVRTFYRCFAEEFNCTPKEYGIR